MAALATAVAPLTRAGRGAVLDYLRRDPRANLFLIELADQVGERGAFGEGAPRVLVGRQGDAVVGVVSQRPAVVLDAHLGPDTLSPFLGHLASLSAGLVRSPAAGAESLWRELVRRGRRAVVDRTETAFCLRPAHARLATAPGSLRLRPAGPRDLEPLVQAARASLREEGRPDPFEGDRRGFRAWVRARLSRALVAEEAGRVVFVGYADVQRPEGWLLQGIYTWPERRGQGLAAAGVSALCRAAFEAGASHVQLSVVDGNVAAVRLYERLGFEPFGTLRTLLFV